MIGSVCVSTGSVEFTFDSAAFDLETPFTSTAISPSTSAHEYEGSIMDTGYLMDVARSVQKTQGSRSTLVPVRVYSAVDRLLSAGPQVKHDPSSVALYVALP